MIEKFFCFPLVPGTKEPGIKDWERNGTWMTWGQMYRSRRPLGLACGPTGLAVVDCDMDKVTGQDVGFQNFVNLCSQRDYMPLTVEVRTPSGGTHFYYERPAEENIRNSANKVGLKIDVRGIGGYVVAPGTEINGARYELGYAATLEVMPEWLCAALRRPVSAEPRQTDLNLTYGGSYGETALRNEVMELIRTASGGRNHALNRCAYNLGQLVPCGALSLERVRDVLTAAGRSIGLGNAEVNKTVYSGIRSGMMNPRIPRR